MTRPEFQRLIDAFAAEYDALLASQEKPHGALSAEQARLHTELPPCDSRASDRRTALRSQP